MRENDEKLCDEREMARWKTMHMIKIAQLYGIYGSYGSDKYVYIHIYDACISFWYDVVVFIYIYNVC